MQIDDRIRDCVAFLGEECGGQFNAYGTAFFVHLTIEEHDFVYLITARHVVWPHRRTDRAKAPDGDISIRINTKSGLPKLIKTKRSEWIFHPDKSVDLCLYEFNDAQHNSEDNLEYSTIAIPTMTLVRPGDDLAKYGLFSPRGEDDLSLGDEVFLISAFISHVGARKNIPIVRIGNVSALPEEPIEFFSPNRPAYLIETRSLGGVSGSPAFLHLYPERSRGDRITRAWGPHGITNTNTGQTRLQLTMPYLLMGIVLGTHGGNFYKDDFVLPPDAQKLTDSDLNSGLTVLLPAAEIIAFLYAEKIKLGRESTLELRRSIVGLTRQSDDR